MKTNLHIGLVLFALVALVFAFDVAAAPALLAPLFDNPAGLLIAPVAAVALPEGMGEIKQLIEDQGRTFEEFKTRNDARLDAFEQSATEIAKKANRPGAPGTPGDFEPASDVDMEGIVTLRSHDLKSRHSIAQALRIKSEENPVRIGEFMRAAAGMKTERKGLTEGTDPSGGYTVPDVLMPGIMAALAPASSMLSAGANIVKLDQKAQSFKIAGISTIPTAGWRGERDQVPESDPAFRAITIVPKSLAFYFKCSRELLQDSPGLDTALNTVIGQAFAKAIDLAGLLGSGAGNEPRGLANTTGINTVDLGANGTALASFSPFVQAMTAIASDDAPKPTAAIMAPRTFGDVANLVDTTGQPLRRPEALSSWNFQTSSQVPIDTTVGTSADCSRLFVGDFTNFSFYMRENLSVQLLKELFAATGEVAFFCHMRLDTAAFYAQSFCVVNGVRPSA